MFKFKLDLLVTIQLAKISLLPAFLKNKISLELSLKYSEVYHATHTPEVLGLLISAIIWLFSTLLSLLTFIQLKFDLL